MKEENKISIGYKETGPYVDIHMEIPWESLECIKMPKSCIHCPVGYSKHGCGRNIPFSDDDYSERPVTCKLKQVDIRELVNKLISEEMHNE